jgi:TfoX/Sxy family transcriptional regulator of competence genes
MAYDEALADRIRHALGPDARVVEIKMFGGLCFMLRGHMALGVMDERLMVRVGAENYDRDVKLPHAGPMMFTGRPMKGILVVDAAGCSTARSVKAWTVKAQAFNATLPDKKPKAKKPRLPKHRNRIHTGRPAHRDQ